VGIVSFVKIERDELDAIKRAILESLSLIRYSFLKETKDVVIKPNLCYYWDHSTGQTTDPKFVGALIDVIREQISPNVNISIAESDASAMKCKHAFQLLGYEQLAKEYKVNLVNLSEDKTKNVQTTVNGHQFDLLIPQTIHDADLRINVPKIKYMSVVKVSSAMKNIFGCNPIPQKFKLHPILNESIIALNKVMKFDLHILDGIVLLGTLPCRLNLVMASEDPVAFDAASSKLAGENPRKIRFISLAQKEGLGDLHYVTRGVRPALFEKSFRKKKTTDKIVASAYAFAMKTGIFKNE
jgi:uncharacterized protein (DUF362 family)